MSSSRQETYGGSVGSRKPRKASSDGGRRASSGEVCNAVEKAKPSRAAARKRWVAARALTKVLILYDRVARFRRIELVKGFLLQLGEWARMRRSIRRLVGSIRKLQAACRRMMQYRRDCCELMQKEWVKQEDLQLSSYFRSYTQKMIKEMKDQAKELEQLSPVSRSSSSRRSNAGGGAARKSDFVQLIEANVESGNVQIDWRTYRLPARERAAIIAAFYRSRRVAGCSVRRRSWR